MTDEEYDAYVAAVSVRLHRVGLESCEWDEYEEES